MCEFCLVLSSIQAQQTREEDDTWTAILNLPKIHFLQTRIQRKSVYSPLDELNYSIFLRISTICLIIYIVISEGKYNTHTWKWDFIVQNAVFLFISVHILNQMLVYHVNENNWWKFQWFTLGSLWPFTFFKSFNCKSTKSNDFENEQSLVARVWFVQGTRIFFLWDNQTLNENRMAF